MNEDKAVRYHRLKRRIATLSVALNGALLVVLLLSGGSARLRDLAVDVSGGSASSAGVVAGYAALLTLLLSALSFPLTFYDGYLLEHRYGLSTEPRGAFLRDALKGTALSVVLIVAAAEALYATMRIWPAVWWLAAAGTLSAGMALLAGLAPIVLLPIFYRFKPIERAELRERLTQLSTRAGVRVLGIYEWGLGEKTRRANAALVGSGSTRRVLVSDTLLAEYSDDEIEVILAHELGHHKHRDMLTVLGVEATVMAVALGAAALAVGAAWQRLGWAAPADVAGLPLIVLTAGAVVLLATPVVNLISRHHERRADRFALALTDRPAAFVSALRRLGAQNLAESNPSTFSLWLFHSHPPVEQRIAAARAFTSSAMTFGARR